MNQLAQLLQNRIEEIEGDEGRELSVKKIADRCKLDFWIVRDALRGKSRRPRPEHLEAFADGLGLKLDDVILAANRATPAARSKAAPARAS